MKKLVSIALALVLALGMCLSAGAQEDAAIRVASLKGPTTMGMAKLIKDSEAGTTQNKYEFTMAGAADEIVPLMVRGELDMALIPCNLASVLYNNTKGAVEVLAVNTLGVLYVLEAGDKVNSVADLAGKTVYSTGKNTTPQYALNYVLSKNGLDPEKDLTVEYKSEAYAAFTTLVDTMYEDFLRTILRIEVVVKEPRPQAGADEESEELRGARYSGPSEVDGDRGAERAGRRVPAGGKGAGQAGAGKPMTYRKADHDPYAGVGRNDPCPCGSGKKFKNCHGRNR